MTNEYQESSFPSESSDMRPLLEAEQLLTQTLSCYNDDKEILLQRSHIRIMMKEYVGALADLERIDSFTKDKNTNSIYFICILLERLGKPKKKYIDCYKKSANYFEKQPNIDHITLSLLYTLANDETSAKNHFKMIKLKEKDFIYFFKNELDSIKTDEGRSKFIKSALP